MSFPLSQAIADHVVAAGFDRLPAAAASAARRSLLDGLGVMLGASGLAGEAVPFADLAALSGGGPCTLLGREGRVGVAEAAFANGALAHALDFEDSFDIAPVHPNACLLPAALAWSEAHGPISGAAFLAALAVGCDLVCRLGIALRCDPSAFGWYPPPILGGFGAAATCGKLAGLSAAQMTDAFSLLLCSSTCSAEIKYSPDSHIRAVRDAFPAQAAVRSVQLAALGVRGFDRPFEGKAGLFAMYARGDYAPEDILDGLGERYWGEALSYKPWPSCRGTHPFIGAAITLAGQRDILPADIAQIELAGHPILRMLSEPEASKQRPSTAIDAKFSLPFTVATALIDRAVTLDSFSPASLQRADVAELARRVRITIDEAAPADAIVAGTTTITLQDGRAFSLDLRQAHGHPSAPMSDGELEAKFRMCAARAARPLGRAQADQVIAGIAALPSVPDAAEAIFAGMEYADA